MWPCTTNGLVLTWVRSAEPDAGMNDMINGKSANVHCSVQGISQLWIHCESIECSTYSQGCHRSLVDESLQRLASL